MNKNLVLETGCSKEFIVGGRTVDEIENILNDYYFKIEKNKDTIEVNDIIPLIYVYAESYEYLKDKNKWNYIILEHLKTVKHAIEEDLNGNGLALFGGLCDCGLAVYLYSKNTGHYFRFWQAVNQVITNTASEVVEAYLQDTSNLKMQHYDCISGMSGILNYFICTDNHENRKLIERIITYLIVITKKKYIYGKMVYGWHIKKENQFMEEEKTIYPRGNFNYGLSHGIAGPLAVLSLAYQKGYQVEGQKTAISVILREYQRLAAEQEGRILWPGQYSFDSYFSGSKDFLKNDNKMSWCYGSIGILQALKTAANILDHREVVDWVKENINKIAKMDSKLYKFESPTICHGYAGLLALLTVDYRESENEAVKKKIEEVTDIIINSYDSTLPFGFRNVDIDFKDGGYYLKETYGNAFLEGTSGILLALISLVKKNTSWEIHLLAK